MKSFCRLKILEEHFENFILYYYNGALKHEGFVGFENACSRANTYITKLRSFLCRLLLMMSICDGLECLYVKYNSHVSTVYELPD